MANVGLFERIGRPKWQPKTVPSAIGPKGHTRWRCQIRRRQTLIGCGSPGIPAFIMNPTFHGFVDDSSDDSSSASAGNRNEQTVRIWSESNLSTLDQCFDYELLIAKRSIALSIAREFAMSEGTANPLRG